MTLEACAGLVERGDPDRFLAAMAAPPRARTVLFPLYAFNVEVSRAPWLSAEPMIVEMRLQWWRDALHEIGAGGPVRRHEVTTPLSVVLDAEGAAELDRLVAARRADTERAPFASAEALESYLEATGGGLMWTAVRLLGAPGDVRDPVLQLGRAAATANYLQAVADLAARGREPLPPGLDPAELASRALTALAAARPRLSALPREARAALLPAWLAPTLLRTARRAPSRVAEGQLRPSEFTRRTRLMLAAARGRV